MYAQLKSVPKEQIRCDQVGDWWLNHEGILATCGNFPGWNDDQKIRIMVHELIEAYLCQKHGVTEQAVLDFDDM